MSVPAAAAAAAVDGREMAAGLLAADAAGAAQEQPPQTVECRGSKGTRPRRPIAACGRHDGAGRAEDAPDGCAATEREQQASHPENARGGRGHGRDENFQGKGEREGDERDGDERDGGASASGKRAAGARARREAEHGHRRERGR